MHSTPVHILFFDLSLQVFLEPGFELALFRIFLRQASLSHCGCYIFIPNSTLSVTVAIVLLTSTAL
jgi:hypothetical protein